MHHLRLGPTARATPAQLPKMRRDLATVESLPAKAKLQSLHAHKRQGDE
jgi:hypothetical protein